MKNKYELEKEFISEIDVIMKKDWVDIYKKIKDYKISSLVFYIDLDKTFLQKYKLTDDISIRVNVNPSNGQTEYCYQGNKIDPECFYLRPEDYVRPTILEILYESIIHNTYRPDIRHLEQPNKKTQRKDKLNKINEL